MSAGHRLLQLATTQGLDAEMLVGCSFAICGSWTPLSLLALTTTQLPRGWLAAGIGFQDEGCLCIAQVCQSGHASSPPAKLRSCAARSPALTHNSSPALVQTDASPFQSALVVLLSTEK